MSLTGMYNQSSFPLAYLCEVWMEKIKAGTEARHERFGQYALEAENFFDGPLNYMWQQQRAEGPSGFLDKNSGMLPTFRISVNKLYEAVSIFGPALYYQNPTVLVDPLEYEQIPPEALGFAPDDPIYATLAMQDQYDALQKKACAGVKQRYLNWLNIENDKKAQARRVITETVVAGLGFFYTQMHVPPGGRIKLPRSQYLSWKDVVVDPDAEYREDIQWIAIRHVEPANKVEKRFGITPGALVGHYQSAEAQATRLGRQEKNSNRRNTRSYDLVEYWEIYSKNGMGHRLRGASEKVAGKQFDFDVLGDYTYLVVAKDIPFPLNASPEFVESLDSTGLEQFYERVSWPIPYWSDSSSDGGWPISWMTFCERIKSVWPMPTFKPVMSELQFVNWCLSFAADRIAASCHTYMAIPKAANVQIQKSIGNHRVPFTVIEVAGSLGISPDKLISFVQAPPFSADLWNMVAAVLELIDKRTGLTELAYGLTSRQMRSATEARTRDENISVRPDDMAMSVENTMTQVATREIQAARWFCEPQDVLQVVGPLGALLWERYILTQDVDAVVRDYRYRVETGSSRRPNREGKVQQMLDLAQYIMPVMSELIAAGNPGPWNAFVSDMAELMDLDAQQYLVQMQPAGPDQAGAAEAAAVQAEMQQKAVAFEQEMQFAQAKHDQDMQFAAEEHDIKMAAKEQESDAKVDQMKEQAKAKPKPKPTAKPAAKRGGK